MPLWYRRHRHPHAQHLNNPTLNRTAVLEHDTLNIEPEPGTPAAYAALSHPLDHDTCPHEDATDVIPLSQNRSTGICATCHIDIIETDEGLWDHP
ncbi:hypothetical protein [Streptomyces fractus]|uniref:hypothetical protein n=1 Tax=Streptomyces fractus TaxID=641806 RepID=UPI003CFB1B6C